MHQDPGLTRVGVTSNRFKVLVSLFICYFPFVFLFHFFLQNYFNRIHLQFKLENSTAVLRYMLRYTLKTLNSYFLAQYQ